MNRPCPNCRGPANVVAVWKWIDHDKVTQYIPYDRIIIEPDARIVTEQLRNNFDPNIPSRPQLANAFSAVCTSEQGTQTDPIESAPDTEMIPETNPSAHASESSFNGLILPCTFTDWREWCDRDSVNALGGTRQASASIETLTPGEQSFHTETRLKSGEHAILIDPGSVGNLGGDKWAQCVAKSASDSGRQPEQTKRDRPLHVSGVGNGSQECQFNVKLPVAFKQVDGRHSKGTFQIPTVPNSELPGLLGLQSMRERKTILDLHNLQIHFLGPADYDLSTNLPPGTESYQCELSPSGHMMLPCGRYAGVDREERGSLDTGPALALPVLPTAQVPSQAPVQENVE